MAKVVFLGVRGSHPTARSENLIYGGNTSCVVIYSDEDPEQLQPLIFDLGTGLGALVKRYDLRRPFDGVAFLSHFHFDHVQGLPFFSPIDRLGAKLTIYGPLEKGIGVEETLESLFVSPYFPVGLGELRGEIVMKTLKAGEIELDLPGAPRVTVGEVAHTNAALGFRLNIDGKVIVYIADHQAPAEGFAVEPELKDLCLDADLLIHDAQYTADEFVNKAHWGHSTYDFAVSVAVESQAKALAFFHHDPNRTDAELTQIEEYYRTNCPPGLEVFAAREGIEVLL